MTVDCLALESMAVLHDLRALLPKTLREGSLDPLGGSIARRCAGDGSFPLSYGQQRLWLLDQIQSGSRTYNEFSAIRIQGRLDFAVLGRSLNEIVRRHEALRTVFPTVASEPIQRIAPSRPVELPVVDLSQLPKPEQTAEIERLAVEETNHS